MKYYARIGGNEYEIEFDDGKLYVNGEPLEVDLRQSGAPELYSMLFNGRSYELLIEAERFRYGVTIRGDRYDVLVEDERQRRLTPKREVPELPEDELPVTAPIPGLVVKVLVEAGDEVKEGQPLIVLEAMKMENEIRAARDGMVKEVRTAPGQRIEQNGLLVVLE